MQSEVLERLQATLAKDGPAAAIDRLCSELKQNQDYPALFYALLMKKRFELGASPIATGMNDDLPPAAQEAFENGIREACGTVGQLFLDDGKIPQAFGYFRMIGDTAPIAQALEKVQLADDEDVQPLIDIAFQQGAAPKKGFDWLLQRYGICNAITTITTSELPFSTEVRDYCKRTLIRTLHNDLLGRLKEEVKRRDGAEPTGTTIAEIVAGREWLFADDFYHIDLSHLNAVVQMAGQIEVCEETRLAKDLCAYGKHLSPKFIYNTDPPFDNAYHDYDVFLSILLGEDVDKNLAHFRKKADDADPETVGTYPAEVLVNLLLRIGRQSEALEASKKHLSRFGNMRLSCPTFVELCQKTGNYAALAEVAKQQGEAVNFLAGLLGKSR